MLIQPIGVPYDLHHPNVRMGRAPALLLPRLAGLGLPALRPPVMLPVTERAGDAQHALGAILAELAEEVRRARAAGALPLVIGGDCMVSLGVMGGLADAAAGIVWLDAHGDFNTPETTPSGYLGGMPLAIIAGRALEGLRHAAGMSAMLPEERIVLLGPRDLDPPERAALEASPVALFSSDALRTDPDGIEAALARLGQHGPIYLHLDVDILDPTVMPGVVYPTPAGLRLDELHSVLWRIRAHCTLAAIALTALNLDAEQPEQALETALQLVQALLEDR